MQQLPSSHQNMMKSLTSVHLPPPPSTAAQHALASGQTQAGQMRGPGQPTTPAFVVRNGHGAYQAVPTPYGTGSSPVDRFSMPPPPVLGDVPPSALNTPPQSTNRAIMDHHQHQQHAKQMMTTPTIGGGRRGKMAGVTGAGASIDGKENHHSGLMQPPQMMLSPLASSPAHLDDGLGINDRPPLPPSFESAPPPMPSGPLGGAHSHHQSQSQQQQQQDGEVADASDDGLPEPHEMAAIVDDGQKPPFSYATLIGMAILRAPERKLTLSQIYAWITTNFSYYRVNTNGWQNSIRHNLSLNRAFKKKERPKSDPGKGNYWVIEKGLEKQFLDGAKGVKKVTAAAGAASRSRSLSSLGTGGGARRSSIGGGPGGDSATAAATSSTSTSTSTSTGQLPDRVVAPLSVQQGRERRTAATAALAAVRPRVPSSTDEEVHDDSDKDYDSDNDTDQDDASHGSPGAGDGGDADTDLHPLAADGDHHHGHDSTQFGPTSAVLPLERPRSAIGLQHFASTTIEAESPLRKRGAGAGTLSVLADTDTANDGPELKKRRLAGIAESPLKNNSNHVTGNNNNHNHPHHHFNSSSHNPRRAGLDADGFPNLEPPPTAWVPYMTTEDSGMIWNNMAQDPPLTASPRGPLGEPLTLGVPPPRLGGLSNRPSPLKNDVFATQRAMFRSVTTPADMDDLMASPSASARRGRRADSTLGIALDDDPVSRALFGSPDKRERQQYFEHSGVSFGVGQSAMDVFGVDICSVVRRAVESKADGPGSDDGASTGPGPSALMGPSPRKLSAADEIRFDSPIKNQSAYFTPPRLSRSDTAYF